MPIAAALDAARDEDGYSRALAAAKASFDAPDTLPSARVLAATISQHDRSFVQFVRQQSLQTQERLLQLPWSTTEQAEFEGMVRQSVLDQKAIEAADTMPFEVYRQQYVSADRLG